MDNTSPAALAVFFAELAELAAAETLPRFRTGSTITNKEVGDFDPVTEADRMAEKAIRERILQQFPNHSILGEEWGITEGSEPYRWVIDPVDGTRAFICGAPVWTTLVGLEFQGELIAGMIDQPYTGERWIGGKDLPAQFSDQRSTPPPQVSTCTELADARVMVTDIRGSGAYFTSDESNKVNDLARQAKLLRMGLDSYGFGLLASGQLDLVVEAGLSWYDIAGVIPVVEAAGGVVTRWDGAPVCEPLGRGDIMMAATPELAAAASDILQ